MKHLVLVHGYLGSSLNWGPILSRLKTKSELKDWSFSAVDLLGHAYRPLDSGVKKLTLDEVSRDLETQVPPGEFFALGHSFGLRPLLRLNSLYPNRLRALIVEDTSPELSRHSFEFLKDVVEATPIPFRDREESRKYFDGHFPTQPALSRFLQSNIRPDKDGRLSWRFNAPALRSLLEEAALEKMWSEWSAFAGALHMIVGGISDYTNPELLARCVQSRGAKTEIHRIEQSGHWVHSEQPELFTNCLVKILTGF